MRERIAKMAGLVELPESVFLPVDKLMALLQEVDQKARLDELQNCAEQESNEVDNWIDARMDVLQSPSKGSSDV